MHHPHPRQLPLHLHLLVRLRVEAICTDLSTRCSRPLVFGSTSGITRYATMSDARPGAGKEPSPFQDPYPSLTHAKPTPHQIFHLRPGATQQEIKERCTSSHFISYLIPFLKITIKQTTTSSVRTTQIHFMLVSPSIIQQTSIHAFDLSKLHMIFYEDTRYRLTLTLLHRHLHRILILTCMNWLGEGEHTMQAGILSEKQPGRKALGPQGRRGGSGMKMEIRRD